MKTAVAVLCAAVLAGSLIVASTNVWLVRSLTSSGPVAGTSSPRASGAVGRRPTIAVMPKAKGDPTS
jgi:hypothetical protein